MSPKFNIKIMDTKAKGCKFFKEFIVCNAIEIFFKFKLGFELRIISQFRGVTNVNIPLLHEMVTDSISDDEKMRDIIQLIIPEITEPQAMILIYTQII